MLTAQEKLELQQLEQKSAPPQISQSELMELQQLEAKAGILPEQQNRNQILQQIQQPPPEAAMPTGRQFEAFAQGIAKGATAGYIPQIQAAVQQIMPSPAEPMLPPTDIIPRPGRVTERPIGQQTLRQAGFNIQEKPQSYTESRDDMIRRQQGLEQEFPVVSTAGQIGGALAMGSKLPFTGKLFGSKIAGGALSGALISFLQNPGDTEGVTDPLQVSERLDNAVSGIKWGGGISAVGAGAGVVRDTLKKLPGAIENFAQLQAVKASGAMLKDFRKLFKKKKANELGQFLLDKKIVQIGDDFEKIAKKTAALKNEVWDELGSIYDDFTDQLTQDAVAGKVIKKLTVAQKLLQKSTSLDMPRIVNELKKEIQTELKGVPGSKSALSRSLDELDTIAENGKDLNIKDVHKIRKDLDKLINFDKTVSEAPLLQKQLIKVRNKLNDKINERLGFFDNVFGTEKTKRLRELNKEFGNLAEIDKIATDRIARDNANASLGLRERISGGAGVVGGAVVGGIPGALALGAAAALTTKALRKYGSAATASIASKTAQILSKEPGKMGKFTNDLINAANESPGAFVKTIRLIQNDPEFKEVIKGEK